MKLKGLSHDQAVELLRKYGFNYIPKQQRRSWMKIFISQFNNFLTLLLLGATLVSVFVGELTDGILIFSIVFLNALFGVYQEKNAEKSIEELSKITVTKSRVVRDGFQQEIDSKYLVPGDIVFLEEGTKIPADGEIVESINLAVNEASLTGESLPVNKKLGDKAYMGTIVVRGRGFFRVSETGSRTKLGQVILSVKEVKEVKTPLQKKLEETSKIIGYLGMAAAVVVFVLSYLQTRDYFSSFLLSVALAVAIVPEGLPAVLTITLSLGVKKLAKKNTIVRKLESIEALGSITVLATDKTGTLTENKMKVQEVFLEGEVIKPDYLKESYDIAAKLFFLTSVLCSTASISKNGDVLGDPTEGALLIYAKENGFNIEEIREKYPLLEEDTFDSKKKMMSVTVKDNKKKLKLIKGAPEVLLRNSKYVYLNNKIEILNKTVLEQIRGKIKQWAAQGSRVLAFAVEDGGKSIFVGMVALYDPPRSKIAKVVERAIKAGIRPVIITGDNEKTAITIGKIANIYKEGDLVLTGEQIDEMSDSQLKSALTEATIFARTTPFHKARIVKLYQSLGEIVAVTGDGVNDTIALRQADVGIAMGKTGTDAAKEAADIIILDDNFKTIIDAVEEGRQITHNLKKAIKYLLSCNTAEMFSLIIASLLRLPRLFYPVQLLYINLITDGLPALALSFSPKSFNLMRGRFERLKFLTRRDIIQMVFIGVSVTVLVFISLFKFNKTAAFSVLTLTQSVIFLYMWNNAKLFPKNYLSVLNPIFVVSFLMPFILQYFIVSNLYLASLFRISTVSIFEYLTFVLISFSLLFFLSLISLKKGFLE